MSKRQSKTYCHQAKDGLFYKDYQSKVTANIKFNKSHMEKMGLGDSFVKEKQERKQAAANAKKKSKKKAPSTPPTEIRRSNRVRKVTPEFSVLPDTFVEPRKKRRSKPPPGSRSSLGRDELEALKNLPDWLDGMEEFLLSVPHGGNNKVVSRDNARSVMKQTRRMVAGMGIEYHHWDEGVIWKKGVKIDLGMDFDALHDEAVEFEAQHGRDLGNGWLMRHAIRKMQCYQEYLAEKQKETEKGTEE